jgi:hypothetical protein
VRRLGVLGLLVGVLAGAPFASAGVKNACTLVTAADVSSALSAKVAAGKHKSAAGFNTCVYTHGKVSVTVRTRPLTQSAYRAVVKSIPGLALNATDVSKNAWVYFPKNATALDDWKQGNQIGFVVVGAGPAAVVILKQLGKVARSRV